MPTPKSYHSRKTTRGLYCSYSMGCYHTSKAAGASAEESSGVAAGKWRGADCPQAQRLVYSAAIEPAKARSQDSSNRRVIFLAEAAA
jgi:hypothetical protein